MADALELYLFLTRNRLRTFQDVEDFYFLKSLFENVLDRVGLQNDLDYDWLNNQK